jgi:hypothetical protein
LGYILGIFSQAHLVTLIACERCGCLCVKQDGVHSLMPNHFFVKKFPPWENANSLLFTPTLVHKKPGVCDTTSALPK